MSTDLLFWGEVVGRLALAVLVAVALSGALSRLLGRPRWGRLAWQVCWITIFLIFLVESNGINLNLVGFDSRATTSRPTGHSTAPNHPVEPMTSADAEGVRKEDGRPPEESGTSAEHAERNNRSSRPERHPPGGAGTLPDPAATSGDGVGDPPNAVDVVWWPALIWALGTLAIGGRLLLVWGRFRWRCRPLQTHEENEALDRIVESIARRLGSARRIRLEASEDLVGPAAIGIVRPRIVLPPDFGRTYSPQEQWAVLAHEIAHLLQHDPKWRLWVNTGTALLWWHPAVWWARRSFYHVSEMVADEASTTVENGPDTLAECLIVLGRRLRFSRDWKGRSAIGGAGRASELERRIRRLLAMNSQKETTFPLRRPIHWIALGVGPISLSLLAMLTTVWSNPRPPETSKGDQAMKDPMRFWKQSMVGVTMATLLNLNAVGEEAAGNADRASEADPAPPQLNRQGAEPSKEETTETTKEEDGRHDREKALRERYGPEAPGAPQERPRSRYRSSQEREFEERYGLEAPGAREFQETYGQAPPPEREERSDVQDKATRETRAKLKRIVIDEITIPDLPLSEFVSYLREESAARDPEGEGINFAFDRRALEHREPSITLESTRINFEAKQIRLLDALELAVRTATAPIRYEVCPYGVVFTHDSSGLPSRDEPSAQTEREKPSFRIATFQIEPKMFSEGMQALFGVEADLSEADRDQWQGTVQQLFKEIGMPVTTASEKGDRKAVYNPVTGILLVKVREDELRWLTGILTAMGGESLDSW